MPSSHHLETESSSSYHLETEQMLLAALMNDNLTYESVSDFLKSEHFYVPAHQKLYQYIEHLLNNAMIATPITLEPLLSNDIDNATEYLAQLAVMITSISAVKTYGKQIHDAFLRRRLIHLGDSIKTNASKTEMHSNALTQIEQAEQTLFELAMHSDTENKDSRFGTAVDFAITSANKAFKKDSHIVGITTGLHDLDKCIGGLHNSDLIILAGRPSMGKTSLAVNIGFNAAKTYTKQKTEGAKVLFFSLEMSTEQLAMRILGQESGIPSDKIRRGAISAKDLQYLSETSNNIRSIPFFIDDTPALTIQSIRSKVRRMKRQEEIDLVIIDYLQLLSGSSKTENRVQELSALTRGLKSIAKEFNIPIIVASQLSRAVEQREDKHPQLSDLRESGTIEQDADIVIFIYRESYYVARKKPQDGSPKMDAWQQEMAQVYGKATLMIAKQRHGPIRNITAHYNEALTKFDNYFE